MIASEPPAPGQLDVFAYARENPDSATGKGFRNPPGALAGRVINARQWRGAEIPAANGHTTARALARLYGALARGGDVDGVRVLSAAEIVRCHAEESYGTDEVLRVSTRLSTGFMLTQPHDTHCPTRQPCG